MQTYCCLSVHPSAFHVLRGHKSAILASPADHAPKAVAIVEAVATEAVKSLVPAQNSYKVLHALLLAASTDADQPFRIATMAEFAEFNSHANVNGEIFRVMIARSDRCGEGISFKEVLRVHIAEPPQSYLNFTQLCGRAVRVRVQPHARLPSECQAVRFTMYIATVPAGLSADEAALKKLRTQLRCVCPSACALPRLCHLGRRCCCCGNSPAGTRRIA